jgi:hypothetical protein
MIKNGCKNITFIIQKKGLSIDAHLIIDHSFRVKELR